MLRILRNDPSLREACISVWLRRVLHVEMSA